MTTENIQKIRSLIWTNAPVNDQLALELIKANKLNKVLLPELVAVTITTKEESIKEEYLAYLKQVLPPFQYLPIANSKFNDNSKDIAGLIEVVEADVMLLTHFKRTKKGLEEFLKYPLLKSSPYRKEAVTTYTDQIKEVIKRGYTNYHLVLNYLTFEELENLFQDDIIGNFAWSRIILNNSMLADIPPSLANIKTLRSLDIRGSGFKEFPYSIFQLNNLKRLSINKLSCPTLPQDWSSLPNLTHLDFGSSQLLINDFSFIDTLPQLKELNINDCKLSSNYLLMHKKRIPIKRWYNFRHLSSFPLDKFLTYASALKKSSLSQEDQKYFFDLVLRHKNFEELPNFTPTALLKALSINSTPLKIECFKRLEQWTANRKGIGRLKKGSTIYILGKTNLGKKNIQNKLKELGIQYASKFSEEVTHLLVGKNPKGPFQERFQHLSIITENQLQKFFSTHQPQFIEQGVNSDQTEIQERLISLLSSPDAANVLIGLEILQSGGVPADLIEQLLVLQKTYDNSKVRAKAKQLLELYAPSEWLPLIRDKQHFAMVGKSAKEQEINKKFQKVAKKTSVDLAAMLSIAIYKVHKRGLRYIFYHFRKPHAWRTKAFQATMTENHFDYSSGLGFTNLKDRAPESVHLWKVYKTAPFPADIVKVIEPIESINFHNCKFDKIHHGIGRFKNLKRLDYSWNLIKEIPPILSKLHLLEFLDLSGNKFSAFPIEVLSLKNLKKLDLRHMRNDMHNPIKISIPEDAKRLLPNCEILV